MASRVAFAWAIVGLCLVSCNGVQGMILTGEDDVKLDRKLKSQYKSHVSNNVKERPYISPKAAMVNVTNTSPQDGYNYITHWALMEATKQKEYYGTKVSINAWALPDVKSPQLSFSGVWLRNGGGDETNLIQAGWHVHPRLYGDSKTRFYIFWTADNMRQTGCYNLRCQGFVMNNNTVVPGYIVSPLSTVHGDQYYVVLTIYKDRRSGDWWLRYHINDEVIEVGYWPKSIFTSLAGNADVIQWGGMVAYPFDESGPPMGSGYYPDSGFGISASIRHIQFVDQDNNLYDPDYSSQHLNSDDDACYTAYPVGVSPSDGYHFYYGGNSGRCRE